MHSLWTESLRASIATISSRAVIWDRHEVRDILCVDFGHWLCFLSVVLLLRESTPNQEECDGPGDESNSGNTTDDTANNDPNSDLVAIDTAAGALIAVVSCRTVDG